MNKPLSLLDFQKIQTGVLLHDGYMKVDAVDNLSEDRKSMSIEIHLGKNRIIRRIFEHLNYRVSKLDRIGYENLTTKNLFPGKWRFLSKDELYYLQYFV